MSDIGLRVRETRDRIAQAARRSGREAGAVRLLAISKKMAADRVRAAIDAGVEAFGENRVQEAETKIPLVPEPAEWHLVGRLQSNKARLAAALFDAVHSLDRTSLAHKLDAAAAERDKVLPVYVQVEYVRTDRSSEQVESDTHDICRAVLEAESLELVGLMTLPPFDPDPELARPWFRQLRQLRDRLADRLATPLPGLSMGMTNDFEVAIEEGSTIVRVGTGIFGERPPH